MGLQILFLGLTFDVELTFALVSTTLAASVGDSSFRTMSLLCQYMVSMLARHFPTMWPSLQEEGTNVKTKEKSEITLEDNLERGNEI